MLSLVPYVCEERMDYLFLSEPDRRRDTGGDEDSAEQRISLLNKLEAEIWSLMTAGGRSEARLWLCNTISGITSVAPRKQQEIFVKLLNIRPTNKELATQVLQLLFEKRPRKAGSIVAKRSHVLDKFFQDCPVRVLQWFSNFGDGSGLELKRGAKALSKFAFVNRDICWDELVWKGKHGQSPAMVATKPHYLLDLDMQQTVENFVENVPEFWSSDEFAESLKDGDILFVDPKFFLEFFLELMYKDDSKDVWEAVGEFIMEESFSSLCHRLLITLKEEFSTFLSLLRKSLSPVLELNNLDSTSYWLEFVLSEIGGTDSVDQLLFLNAIVSQRRQLLRLVNDEELQEGQEKIKDIVSQICGISNNSDCMIPMLNKCFKMKAIEAVKLLALQSWVLHYKLLKEVKSPESWESLFTKNGIRFRKSGKYTLLKDEGSSEDAEFELDDRRKRKKKRKSKKKKKYYDDDYNNAYDHELLDFDTSSDRLGLPAGAESWFLSTDGFKASWSIVDLPEHLSSYCFSTWMRWNHLG